MKTIPAVILAPLTVSVWKHDDDACGKFAAALESHAHADWRDGLTASYNLSNNVDGRLTANEFMDMVAAGAIDPVFHNNACINQHWLHSLEQFYAVVYREWRAHIERTEKLIGAPAGRIHGGVK